jgi:hypothetical protein
MFDRICLMKAMHTVVCALNNEDAYYEWIEIVPDEASNDDLIDIAEDDWLFMDACRTFRSIISEYVDDGFYINKKRW